MTSKTKKEKKGDWVFFGGAVGETAHCTRCGRGLRLGLPVAVGVFVAAAKAFVKEHSICEPGRYAPPAVSTPDEWAAGRDTGISSLTIFSAITGRLSPAGRYDIPYDPPDFGRCHRLLKLFPSWRSELAKTIGICLKWKPFVEAWDELTALYEEESPTGKAPRLYERLKQLRNVAA